jgi:hypothetical protein
MGLPFGSFYTDPDEHGFYFPEAQSKATKSTTLLYFEIEILF